MEMKFDSISDQVDRLLYEVCRDYCKHNDKFMNSERTEDDDAELQHYCENCIIRRF